MLVTDPRRMLDWSLDEGGCVRFAGGFISIGGALRKISVNGKTYYFEWHHYLGPSMTTKRGDTKAQQPGERHPWWNAVSWWHAQGSRVDADGFCIWEQRVSRQYVRHVGKRDVIVCSEAEADSHIDIKVFK